MRRPYSNEMMQRAEDLYCCDGHSLRAVSELTGVSTAALKRWSVQYGWAVKKREFGLALMEIRRNTVLLRRKLIEQCLDSLDAREAIAVLSMETLARKEERDNGPGRGPLPAPEIFRKVNSDGDAAAALETAYRTRMKLLALDPGRLDLTAIKGLREAMSLADELKQRGLSEEDKPGGLSDEVAAEIRRKILGLSS